MICAINLPFFTSMNQKESTLFCSEEELTYSSFGRASDASYSKPYPMSHSPPRAPVSPYEAATIVVQGKGAIYLWLARQAHRPSLRAIGVRQF